MIFIQLLVSMSEAAKANQIYVVFNTRELVDCIANDSNENCPEAKRYIFNTNVVLDRSGAVIDRFVPSFCQISPEFYLYAKI